MNLATISVRDITEFKIVVSVCLMFLLMTDMIYIQIVVGITFSGELILCILCNVRFLYYTHCYMYARDLHKLFFSGLVWLKLAICLSFFGLFPLWC